MKIERGVPITAGSLYMNKTSLYIVPIVYHSYGKIFTKKCEHLFKCGIGLNDAIYAKAINKVFDRHLFILFDSMRDTFNFSPTYINLVKETFTWFRLQEFYETDYIYDDIQNGRLHMFVFKLPDAITVELLDCFFEGTYSFAMSKEDIEKYYTKESHAYKVLTKESAYKAIFHAALQKEFGIDFSKDDDDFELDKPFIAKEEYFSYINYKNDRNT